LLDQVFEQQDHLWDTDQGKSFKSFWEFLMSQQMQEELEALLYKINDLPEIGEVKRDKIIDKIKINLVDAGDKVNRSNDGLVEQLRKFVEQKNLTESRNIILNIEKIEALLLDHKQEIAEKSYLMEIDGFYKPDFIMGRPLFSPPLKVAFAGSQLQQGQAKADTDLLFNQFYVDLEVLRSNIRQALKTKPQVSLGQLITMFPLNKGVAEVLGYLQIATNHKKHLILRDQEELIDLEPKNKIWGETAPIQEGEMATVAVEEITSDDEQNLRSAGRYKLKVPVILFNR